MSNELSTDCVIKQMLTKYGEDTQIDVAIEEMSELTKELVKYKRTKVYSREKLNNNKQAVKEEMADVLFMLEYLKEIFSIDSEELQQIINQKANRTAERYLK